MGEIKSLDGTEYHAPTEKGQYLMVLPDDGEMTVHWSDSLPDDTLMLLAKKLMHVVELNTIWDIEDEDYEE